MKYWIYYILAGLSLLHPHLWQKLEMLKNYFTQPEYQFWTTFSQMEFLDLLLHASLPIVFIIFGIRKKNKTKSNKIKLNN